MRSAIFVAMLLAAGIALSACGKKEQYHSGGTTPAITNQGTIVCR